MHAISNLYIHVYTSCNFLTSLRTTEGVTVTHHALHVHQYTCYNVETSRQLMMYMLSEQCTICPQDAVQHNVIHVIILQPLC